MLKSISKVICILLILSGVFAVAQVSAYYNDNEDSADNVFSAASLDFSVSSQADFAPDVTPIENATRTVNVQNDGTLDFIYNVSIENATGSLCVELGLKDDLTDTFSALNGFVSANTTFSNKPAWLFTSELISEESSLQNQTCDFDIVFNAWQTDFSLPGQGFFDQERIAGQINSGEWIFGPRFGDVVINELMWMGSYQKRRDEWIELRNMTDDPLDIGGWQLTKLVGRRGNFGEALMLEIPQGAIMPANGFYLISNFNQEDSKLAVEPDLVDEAVSLRNRNLRVKLYKGDWTDPANLIDQADDGDGRPLAGYVKWIFHFSMERNDVPGDGTLAENWHSCFDDSPEMLAYWDTPEGVPCCHGHILNRGTPGGPNLSDYDVEALTIYYQELEQELLAQGIEPDVIFEDEYYDEDESYLVMPETILDSHPEALTASTDAEFTFSSNKSDSVFQCQINNQGFAPCASPKAFVNLTDGVYTFKVYAVDSFGSYDSTPAEFSWEIETEDIMAVTFEVESMADLFADANQNSMSTDTTITEDEDSAEEPSGTADTDNSTTTDSVAMDDAATTTDSVITDSAATSTDSIDPMWLPEVTDDAATTTEIVVTDDTATTTEPVIELPLEQATSTEPLASSTDPIL